LQYVFLQVLTSEKREILPAQDTACASSRMTRQRPVPCHERHCQSGIVRRTAALVIVAFALLAAPTPEAAAQAPPRPEPRELWRQFPLETGRSNPRAPAERESTPEVSVPTTGGTPGEGRDGSVATVQIAAIVLAIALVLMLTIGVLAYAGRGQFEFGAPRRRRRLAQSFPEFLEAPPVEAPPHAETERPERREPTAKRTIRGPGRPRRRAKRAVAARAVASIISEVDALKAKLDVDTAPKKPESPAHDRIERLRERLDMYVASAKNESRASDEVESLKAKLDMHPAPAKSQSIAHERETLKEKLDVQPAHSESAPPDELQTLKEKLEMQPAPAKRGSTPHDEPETLKAKLAKQAAFVNAERETADEVALKEKLGGDAAAAAKRETTVRPALETKLVDHDPGPKSERKVDLHVGRPSPKLDVSDASANDQARGSVDVDAPDTTLREPPWGRAADATPVAPRRVWAARRRSTLDELLYEHRADLTAMGIGIVLALVFLIAAEHGLS
jgi:hypothetical protein